MPDEMDIVQEQNEQILEDILEEHKRRRPTGLSLGTCCICGTDIPEARRKASPGCTKCIVCQTEFESMHGKWGEL